MKTNYIETEVSYFKGLLLAELRTNHPEKLTDIDFIAQRSSDAETLFEQARRDGKTTVQAEEMATEILFKGLHFSKINTIKSVISNEYSDKIEVEMIDALAILLLFKFQEIFDRYLIDDDFGEKPDFARLYTELTGAIHFYFVDYGV